MDRDITNIRVSIPEAVEGDGLLQINKFGGKIISIEREDDSRTGIVAAIPKSNLALLEFSLHMLSGGQARCAEDDTTN